MGSSSSAPAAGKKDKKEKKEGKRRHSHHGGRYDTFPEDPAAVKDAGGFVWEKESAPWKLFSLACSSVGKNIAALLVLFYTLITQKQYLMLCDGRVLHPGILYSCEYTKAYLRAFPLLAVNVSLVVAMRILVQQRVYYGFLKVGGLLDFTNAKQMRDPLFWVLIISLFHGMLHFGLKCFYSPSWNDPKLYQAIGQHFVIPSVIFIVFFYQSSDLEKNLIPLNKYFEEDHDYAQRALGSIQVMDECVVRYDVMNRDAGEDARDYTIKEVYRNIIDQYPAAKARTPEAEFKRPWVEFQLFKAMWPANILLDPRLHDSDSSGFRLMFTTVCLLTLLLQGMTLVMFTHQAYKDVVIDYWGKGQIEDMTSFVVQTIHLVIIIWIFIISLKSALMGRCCACCGYRERKDDNDAA